ncbi:MAG: hypothetical protein KatS3mg085_753 [Candidatus Dojkabacteria bacterium]|nr:MAG: hypothetical protein KatS3mg085_753 [Candidatus Dojkabacteria bacterium]
MNSITRVNLRIAFDINGTLVGTSDPDDSLAMQLLIKRLKKAGHTIILRTGDTVEYSMQKAKELGLDQYIDEYATKLDIEERPDVAFDDVWGMLATGVTIKV